MSLMTLPVKGEATATRRVQVATMTRLLYFTLLYTVFGEPGAKFPALWLACYDPFYNGFIHGCATHLMSS